MRSCIIFFDGAIDRNPGGTACYGAFVVDNNKSKHYPAKSVYGVIGTGAGMTVNVAEYSGLIHGVVEAKKLGYDYLEIYGDSQLVVNMVSRIWGKTNPHGKMPHLQILLYKAWEELEPVMFSITWIPRFKNEKADKLSKYPYSTKFKRRQMVANAVPIEKEKAEQNRRDYFSKH